MFSFFVVCLILFCFSFVPFYAFEAEWQREVDYLFWCRYLNTYVYVYVASIGESKKCQTNFGPLRSQVLNKCQGVSGSTVGQYGLTEEESAKTVGNYTGSPGKKLRLNYFGKAAQVQSCVFLCGLHKQYLLDRGNDVREYCCNKL